MSNDKLAEALRDSTFVAAMLDAICETDGTVDRMSARDAAYRVRDALQARSAQSQPANEVRHPSPEWFDERLHEELMPNKAQAQPPAASGPDAPNYPPKIRYTTGRNAMTNPPDNLRPEVRDTLDWIEAEYPEASTIRAELLRLDALTRELNEERLKQVALRFDERIRAEHAEDKLAALKATIADAPVATLVFTGSGGDLMLLWAENPDEWVGKDVRLLVDEPPAERGEG